MKHLTLALLYISLSQPTFADHCNDALENQLTLASRSPVSDEDLKGTLARLFTKKSALFYSWGFRQSVLKQISAHTGHNNSHVGEKIRQILRNYQADPKRYQSDLQSIGSKVFAQILHEFAQGEATSVRQAYSVRARNFDSVRQDLITIHEDSRLRALMVTLISDIIFHSADTFFLYSLLWEANAKARWDIIAWWIGPYELTKRWSLGRAVSRSTGGNRGLLLDNFSFPARLVLDGARKRLPLAEFEVLFKVQPPESMLSSISGIMDYDREFLELLYAFELKQIDDHDVFLSASVWSSFAKSYDSISRMKALKRADRASLMLSIQGLTRYLGTYRAELNRQQIVLSVALQTLKSMTHVVEERLAQLSPTQATERRELVRVQERMVSGEAKLDGVQGTIDVWIVRLGEAEERLRSLLADLHPFSPHELNVKDLQKGLKEVSKILEIPGFEW